MRVLQQSRNLVALVILALSGCGVSNKTNTAYYPLEKGNYWIYEGAVEEQTEKDIYKTNETWKIEVLEVVSRGHVTGYVMRKQMTDTQSKRTRERQYGIIRVGPTAFYETDVERVDRLKDGNDHLFGLVTPDELFLDVPLVVGKRFGDSDQITREDGYYCWVVLERKRLGLKSIKGIYPRTDNTSFVIRYFTLPDEEVDIFTPGIGYVAYKYSHHGTVSENDMHLSEFHRSQEGITNESRLTSD